MNRRRDEWKKRIIKDDGLRTPASELDCVRIAEIGDLHFDSSSFSTALDYYRQLLNRESALSLELEGAVKVFRKAIDCALNMGDQVEAGRLLKLAMEIVEDDTYQLHPEQNHQLATLKGRQASLLTQRSQYQEALQVTKHAFAILAITDEHKEVGNLQITMGVCHHRLGNLSKAEEFYMDALATFRRINDQIGMSILYNNLSLLHKNACRWRQALDFLDKALAIVASHGDTHLLARMYLNRGIILRKAENYGEARAAFEKSLRLAGSLGDIDRQAKVSLSLGYLELMDGNLVRAEELILEGQHIAEHAGFVRESTIADEYMGDILALQGDYANALYNYGKGLEKTRVIGRISDLEGELLRRCADAHLHTGDYDRAVSTAEAAISVCESCGELYELGFSHLTLGRAYYLQGDIVRGDEHFQTSIRIFDEQNLPRRKAISILSYLESSRSTAEHKQLVVLKRMLLECLEVPELRANDSLLFDLHIGLVNVQMSLDQMDDALLSLTEVERIAAIMGDAEAKALVANLRTEIESSLFGNLESKSGREVAISSVSGMLREELSINSGLTGVLKACIARTEAEAGLLVIIRDNQESVVSQGFSDEIVKSLKEHLFQRVANQDPVYQPLLLTNLENDRMLRDELPDFTREFNCCLCLPILEHDERLGMLILAGTDAEEIIPLFSKSLEYLHTLMGLLAESFATATNLLPPDVEPAFINGQSFENIITANEQMLETLRLVTKVAPSGLTVLLQGETGTGKGLLANAIHGHSERRKGKFVSVNCAAMPDQLLESELFGHVKGSFTGAYDDKIGLLPSAEGGTIFLDEIGKLPLGMQGKLLHFMDNKIVRPVGSNREQKVDVRVICATKGNLQDKVEAGEFLEDLYYRLLDFPIRIPPLRDRQGDIRILAPYFVQRYAERNQLVPPGMTSSFLDAVAAYAWPGNIRELEKTLHRAIVLARDEEMLQPKHLPRKLRPDHEVIDRQNGVVPLRQVIADVEAREIAQALEVSGGNKSQAARTLGISYPNLLKKIKLYEI
jgi:transcriptional regulator with PAS, ATPase and Fis domain/Flp pilus assembly protein TadD